MNLRERLAQIEAELRNLHEGAGDAPLSDDNQGRWDELVAERATVTAAITRDDERRSLVGQLGTTPGHVERSGTDDPLGEPDGNHTPRRANPWDLNTVARSLNQEGPERGGQELRARALAAVEAVRGVSDQAKERLTGVLEGFDFEDDEAEGRGARKVAAHIVATSSPEYMRAWSKAMRTSLRTGSPDMAALQVLQRAASLTDAAGGYAVPLPIDPTIILDDDGVVAPHRSLATVRTITTDKYRIVTSGTVTASYDAEASEVSDDAPTFDKTEIDMHTARAFVPFSLEIGGDFPNFTEQMRFLMADSKANLESAKFTTGSGTGEPFGFITALDGTAYEMTPNTAETFALSDVYDVEEELPARYSANATWAANKRIYQAIREAGGTSLSDFWTGIRDGRPGMLLGHPVAEFSAMDGSINAAATADNFVLAFGDFRYYWIIDRVGFSTELIPHLFHTGNNRPSGQRGIFAWWRNGADVVVNRAFRMLNVATTA